MAKRKQKRSTSRPRSSGRKPGGVLLKNASLAQLEREIEKRRDQEIAKLQREKADIDTKLKRLRSSPLKGQRKRTSSSVQRTSETYTPRAGSHGESVLAALAEGGEWTLDNLSGVTEVGKPTLSAAVLPKLIDEGLVRKSGRGKYVGNK